MPLVRYVCCVGASLVALLFLADARLPRPDERREPQRHVNIRIASTITGPEAVTFSGHPVGYGPAPAMNIVDFSARAADVEKAFAQVLPEISAHAAIRPTPAQPRKRHVKRKIEPMPRLADVGEWPRFHLAD